MGHLMLAQVISNGAQQLETRTKVIFHLSPSEIAEEMFYCCKWEVRNL